jgi:hypothetical protein
MARRFRSRDGRVTGRLEPYEVTLLRGLLDDVVTLVGDDDPENPVTARLFPDASPDPATAADLRDLLHDDLREAKLANARAMAGSLPDDGVVDLDVETAERWLAALNDVRLALGTVIGVTDDDPDGSGGSGGPGGSGGSAEPDDAARDVYHWLTFLQETLVEAVSAGGVQR